MLPFWESYFYVVGTDQWPKYIYCTNSVSMIAHMYTRYIRGAITFTKNAATKFGSASGVQYDPLFWDTAKEVVQVLRVITEN